MIFALTLLSAFGVYSEEVCTDNYTSIDITDSNDLVGRWEHLYTWNINESTFLHVNHYCLSMTADVPSVEDIQASMRRCLGIAYDWGAVNLKITMDAEIDNFAYFTPTNETGQYMSSNCLKADGYFKKISDGFIVSHKVKNIFTAVDPIVSLYGRRIPPDDELDCLINGIDIVKHFKGIRSSC